MDDMTVEQNKAIARRVVDEILNQGKTSVADELFTPGFTDREAENKGYGGLVGFKQYVTELRRAFPDLHYTIDDIIGEGDKTVVRLTGSGTFKNEFMHMSPTDKHATWSEIHIGRLSGGKIAEHWGRADQLGMLQQLGVIPVQQTMAA
jgi:predicted ester cyclase